MLTKQQKKAAKRASKTIGWLDERMNILCDDPMTHAMGAPVGDFYEDWSRKYRSDLCKLLKDPNNSERTFEMLLAELERFFP